ncbi:MAG: acyl carrier protein [Candidatus Babeliaceae bacterium]
MIVEWQNTFNIIQNIIAQQLGISSAEVHLDSTFDSLGADSLDRVEIIMNIEEECHVTLDDKKIDTLKTVKDAVDYVHSLRTAQ